MSKEWMPLTEESHSQVAQPDCGGKSAESTKTIVAWQCYSHKGIQIRSKMN